MLVGDERIDRCVDPVGLLHRRNRRARDAIERLPAIRSEKLAPFLAELRQFRQLFRCGFLLGFARISPREQLGFIVSAITITILCGDQCESRREVARFTRFLQLFAKHAQPVTEGIVREFVETLRVL